MYLLRWVLSDLLTTAVVGVSEQILLSLLRPDLGRLIHQRRNEDTMYKC
jgi:hypothetical protein